MARLLGFVLVGLMGLVGVHFALIESGEVATVWTRNHAAVEEATRLWIVEYEGDLWLNAGSPEAAWLANIRAAPEVRVEYRGTERHYHAHGPPRRRAPDPGTHGRGVRAGEHLGPHRGGLGRRPRAPRPDSLVLRHQVRKPPVGSAPGCHVGAMEHALRYDSRPTSLGLLVLAATERGVCLVRFASSGAEARALLEAEFPWARWQRDTRGLAAWTEAVVARLEGRPSELEVPLDVRGSRFQRRVWSALLRIPSGETRSYAELARAVGQPGAARAVGRACATNPVPVLVPCHRAVRSDGSLGGFLGGLVRKRALLEAEGATAPSPRSAFPG